MFLGNAIKGDPGPLLTHHCLVYATPLYPHLPPGDKGSQSPPLDTYSSHPRVQVTSASVGSTPLASNTRPKVANLDGDEFGD
jgi:hypothetical protein